MSKFLNVARARIDSCYIGGLEDHNLKIDKIIDKLDSLGENARRLLEIGIVQDRLVEFGYINLDFCHAMYNIINAQEYIVTFYTEFVKIDRTNDIFEYTSPTWQDDLINKVKELINYE